MSCELYLSIGALTKIGFSGIYKLEILFGHGAEHLLQLDLIRSKCALIDALFDEI